MAKAQTRRNEVGQIRAKIGAINACPGRLNGMNLVYLHNESHCPKWKRETGAESFRLL